MVQQILFKKLAGFTKPDELKSVGLYPYFRPIEENHDTEVVIQGKRLLMFGSNSYMGLTNHPKVKEAAKKAIDRYGSSCSGSRFLNGTSLLHIELEERLADHLGKEAALIFTTGTLAMSKKDGKATLLKSTVKKEVFVLSVSNTIEQKTRDVAMACPVKIIKIL